MRTNEFEESLKLTQNEHKDFLMKHKNKMYKFVKQFDMRQYSCSKAVIKAGAECVVSERWNKDVKFHFVHSGNDLPYLPSCALIRVFDEYVEEVDYAY